MKYGSTIYELLLKISSHEICFALDICNKSSEMMKVKGGQVMQMTKGSGPSYAECTICNVIMDEMKKYLNEKSTEEEILNIVNKICDIIPSKYRSECHQYINDYGPGVISIISDDFNPDQVCSRLHACSNLLKVSPVKKLHFRSNEECTICKTVIKEVDNLLDQNITEQTIEKALDQVCTKLPSMQDECDQLINQYAPIIFKYVDNILDPSFICQKMKLCPTERIIGGNPCTYGPSYWCANLDTAKECNAVEHCSNHIWK